MTAQPQRLNSLSLLLLDVASNGSIRSSYGNAKPQRFNNLGLMV